MDAEQIESIADRIRKVAPSVIRIQIAPHGLMVSIPKPKYVNRVVGEWKEIKDAAKDPIRRAIRPLLPADCRLRIIMDDLGC